MPKYYEKEVSDLNIEPNYKNKRKYNTAHYPIRQPIYLTGLIWVLSKMMLTGKERRIEKKGMDGVKPPYMLLSNHMSFIDFELAAMATGKHRVNNVVNIDGFYMRAWLMEWIGAICTRKFTTDIHLIKSIRKVLKRGDVLCMYPEARYSQAGITSYIPDSVGMLVKRCGVPVVAIVHHGNYLHMPVWDVRRTRKVPLYTTEELILTEEDIKKMSAEEINKKIREALRYDDYAYQRENGILIKEEFRAEGLHKILYQCPHCKTESKMASKGAEIFCEECGKRWTLGEDGVLRANEGETEFPYVPDWFNWEREQVRGEIERGEYSFSDEVDVYALPRCYKYHPLGNATLTHDSENGFILKGSYRGKEYFIQRMPSQSNSLHVEYDFPRIKPYDCVDISTENDSFYCYPTKQNVITKLTFATEIIYEKSLEASKGSRRDNKT